MTTEPTAIKPDRQQATTFLEALFGRYFKDNEGWLEFRLVPPEKGTAGIDLGFLPGCELTDQVWEEICKANRKPRHVFFGVNPRLINAAKPRTSRVSSVSGPT
jgi:hypothetical protein